MLRTTSITLIGLLWCTSCWAQKKNQIPGSYSKIKRDRQGLYFERGENKFYAREAVPKYTISQLLGQPQGTENGLLLDFGDLTGTIVYGMIPYGQASHPLPVFRFEQTLVEGKVEINIKEDFKYPYDFVGWSEKGNFTIGYRLIDEAGEVLFDGEVAGAGTGPFTAESTLYEGPFVNLLQPNQVTISFETSTPVKARVEADGRSFEDAKASTHHEITVDDLSAGTKYDYTVYFGNLSQSYHFTTAPQKGSRSPFVFGYTSDSRHAPGGGERRIYGANGYIVKKMGALAYSQGAAFIQFTGDMINGYLTTPEETHLQYTNWKKSLEPFWHYIPVYAGMGNHEALGHIFSDESGRVMGFIDRFPYDTQSAEVVMQQAFVNPENGPDGEDGASYDPDPDRVDFPSYKETVFYYTYGNVAMVVLNSDYWYAPSLTSNPFTSGGLHGYLMDNQMDWLRETIEQLEQDEDIDHVFVTQHTPAFPNGGHSRDDMWYNGNNDPRPFVAGKPMVKGIIERRDEYLDILANQSTKVVGILTGDEHNYNWLKLTNEVPIYPENYRFEKISFNRPIYQINNGASGAPYYAQEKLPWSAFTQSFSVENALCLFYIDGGKVTMKVLNPDTLNEIDNVVLRE
ncbi:MAG: metallophosphoesterase family protein [Bacteroidota bacterium]